MNRKVTFSVNDAEYRTFQRKCFDVNKPASEVLRELMREYVKVKK